MNLNDTKVYFDFSKKIQEHRKSLLNLLIEIKKNKKKISELGASTKGNVILQYCKIDNNLLDHIYEINNEKFEKFTPGSNIKILSDKKINNKICDYLLILPWHFKDHMIKKEKKIRSKGIKFIFPLPEIEII